jgi:hypothetical protein
VIRALAGWDPERVRALRRTALRDVLHAADAQLRERRLEQFRHEQVLYVWGGLKRAPEVPTWMREHGC